MAHRGPIRRRLAVTGLAMAGSVLAAEVGVRVTARVAPSVHYLATAGLVSDKPSYATFEDFLAAHSEHLVPHRPWFNYWNNSLGFNDREFEVPKPAGRFRIMALGDSFAYGLLPYPDNVLTLVEERLRTRCGCRDLDLLNFGIGAADVPDYTTLLQLSHARYAPDLIVVHFYMGNDGPDLRAAQRGKQWSRWLPTSYAGNYAWNVWQLRAAGFTKDRVLRGKRTTSTHSTAPRGGEKIDAGLAAPTDRDPIMAAPTFADGVFLRVARGDLFRLYAPAGGASQVEQTWAPTLDLLEAIRRAAIARQSRVALVLFPSAVQVYPTMREQILDRLHARGRHADITLADIDPNLPNRVLLEYCRRASMPCIDVTPAFLDASRQSSDPLYRSSDTHWNIRGNRVAADAEAAALEKLICQEPRSSC
jgi:hypothetical protein